MPFVIDFSSGPSAAVALPSTQIAPATPPPRGRAGRARGALTGLPLAVLLAFGAPLPAAAQQTAPTDVRPLTEVLTFDPGAEAPQVFSPIAPTIAPTPTTGETPDPDADAGPGPVTAPGGTPDIPLVDITPTPPPSPAPDDGTPPVTLPLVIAPTAPDPAPPPTPTAPRQVPVVPTPDAPQPVPVVPVLAPPPPEPPVAVTPLVPAKPPAAFAAPVLDTLVGGPWGFHQLHSVRLSDGGIVLVGNALDPAHARSDPPRIVTTIAHLDRDGYVRWHKTLGERWVQTPLTMAVIPGDGAMVLLDRSTEHGYEQALVVIGKDGRVHHDGGFGLGPADAVRSVAATPEGIAAAVGLSRTHAGQIGFWHAWLKGDGSLGALRPLVAEPGLVPHSLGLTRSGNHVFAHFPAADGYGWGKVWVAGLDYGRVQWRATLDGDARMAVASLRDGGALVPRRLTDGGRSTLVVTRLAPGGGEVWTTPLGHDMWPAGASELYDGSLFVSGWGEVAGYRYGWYARLGKDGQVQQLETFETRSFDRITAGYPYPDGTLILVGQAYVAGAAYTPARVLSYAAAPYPAGYAAAVAPTFVAQVESADSKLRILTAFDAVRGKLNVRRTTGAAKPGRVLELWAIDGDKPPVSLGVLPEGSTASVALPAELISALPRLTFAVSDEPPGGSPTGAPTGAVLATGQVTSI